MKKNSSTLVNKKHINSIAIGSFDGMHKAHQELFKNLSENGAIISIESGASTLTPKKFRQEYSKYPIYSYLLENIKNLEGCEFITLLKEEFPQLEKIVIGFDFRFGKHRKYDAKSINDLFDGEVVIVDEIKHQGKGIHSRYIIELLKNGDIELANTLLGREYKIYAHQIKGQNLGNKEFVPTINLKVDDFTLPKQGVYITKTIVNQKEYNSVTFMGHRATTDGKFAVETHILDEDITNKNLTIQVKFLKLLRENRKFTNFEELRLQIKRDLEETRVYFAKNN